jgi:transketolase
MTAPTGDPRTQFARTTADLLEKDPSTALVFAEISGRFFGDVVRRHPDRVINVGIREQLLVNVGAGMALTGMRPIVHTFGTFLVERAFEQVKLGFAHQGVGGVLVGVGGSFDASRAGRTHQAPGDVALLDTLPDVSIHAPGTVAETDEVLLGCGRRGRAALRAGRGADQPRVFRRPRPPRRTTGVGGDGHRARPCARRGTGSDR